MKVHDLCHLPVGLEHRRVGHDAIRDCRHCEISGRLSEEFGVETLDLEGRELIHYRVEHHLLNGDSLIEDKTKKAVVAQLVGGSVATLVSGALGERCREESQ